jgi:glycerophosphoryl diester phosphodiesterase
MQSVYNVSVRNIMNIAHRGFTAKFPDNTLEAFEAAIELGVDGVEFDVRETADSTFVVFHDPHVQGKAIDKLEYNDIRKIKLNNTFRIPTLEETLDLLKNKTKLLIELKQVQSLENFLALLKTGAERDDVVVASFNRDLVSRFSTIAPGIRTAVITATPVVQPSELLESVKCDGIVVRYPFITAETVSRIHSYNCYCYVWNGRTLSDIRHIIRLDADGIVSDFPDRVKKELQKRTA